jgi:hypothetical protein
MRKLSLLALLVFLVFLVSLPLFAQTDFDDCDARFTAFIGTDAYQFNPWHDGQLGTVRMFTILSYQRAAAMHTFGRALWRLEVSGPDGDSRVVFTKEGIARIDEKGASLADVQWDGHDQFGALVDPGVYHYTFKARFLRDAAAGGRGIGRYDDAAVDQQDEAFASSGEILVDYALDTVTAERYRSTIMATTCQVQQNAPLESGFGYNFYYGSTHSHSNYSDGGQPLTACSSGNAYGSGTFDPAAVFNYAHTNAGLDYWLVNEHNHLFDDALATQGTRSEANVKARYQSGITAAANATVSGSFIALYGMEWGVLTNADQGHVTLIDTPKLFGWETCSTCTGATAECTPGTNCYFDVYTPKRFGYLTMYQRSVENPSPAAGAPLGILAHPSSGMFDNYAFNANADAALQGIAVRSGLAFNTATNCATANVGATDYSSQWNAALVKGFHLAPTGDHDAHCDNFGLGLPTRTVYLIRNNVSPALTKANLLSAHKARHFFASEDPNAQLVFATSDGAHIMGDIFSVTGTSVTLHGAAYDPNGEAVSRMELWRGQIGGTTPTAAYKTFSSVSSFSSTESGTSGQQYWYYVKVVQADGNNIWSAPMWVTFGGSSCTDTTAPTVSIAAPSNGSAVSSCSGATTTIKVSASDASGIGSVQVSIDGGAYTTAPFNSSTGFYELAWSPAAGSHTINAKATDSSCNANVGNATAVSVTGSCSTTNTQLLLNPGFDSGDVNWTHSSGVVTNSTSETPHGGAWYAWLDGYGSTHTDTLYQDVAIPSNATAATLKFYLHIDSAETTTTTAYDTLKVQVRNTSNTVLTTLATYSNLNKATGYTVKQFDLLAYKGQTVRIYFLGVEDSTLQTSFVVDTTSLNVTQ